MVSTIFIPRAAFHPKQNVSFEIGNLFGIKGIVAVITGGRSAKAVYIVGRRKESLEKAAAEAGNGSIIAVQGDVKSKESLEAVAEGMKKEQGSINVLFANSGVIGFKEAVWGPSVEEFTHAYHVNVSGVFYTALPFLELLDEGNKQGDVEQKFNIIVTTSIAGFSRKLSAGFAYSTSKARTTHLLFRRERMRKIEGDILKDLCSLERSGTEEDIAGTALYLMGRGGAYLSGNVIVPDCGKLGEMPTVYWREYERRVDQTRKRILLWKV
ncbi:unnamed protein product [Diplocarpon coronariae]